jgi:MFS-type transporter involved in bile tolerance (Atg22 family)
LIAAVSVTLAVVSHLALHFAHHAAATPSRAGLFYVAAISLSVLALLLSILSAIATRPGSGRRGFITSLAALLIAVLTLGLALVHRHF